MTNLVVAACAFLLIHLLISGTKLRDVIVGAIGEMVYIPLFALASLGAVVWMCIAYNQAYASADDRMLFDAGQSFRNLAIPILFIAFALVVPGVTRSNPTSAGQGGAAVSGVLRITRHPFLWGSAIWAGYHLIASGTLAATIFFATFFVLASLGTCAIDGKFRRLHPAEWQAISSQTSNIPFAAIASGRNRFAASEYFDWRFTVAVVLFGVLLYLHNWMFSLSPFPNNWLPG